MQIGYIYIIRNKENEKFYLGSTKDPYKRKLRHFNELRKDKHHSIHLQRAFNKYGEENFEFIIIETCIFTNYIIREQNLLNNLDFKDCYNVSSTSSGGDFISNHPERERLIKEATERLRNCTKPLPKFGKDNPNWKGGKKEYCPNCGQEMTIGANTCSKCRDKSGENNPFFGKTHSEETKLKISESKKGKYVGNQEKIVIADGIEYKSLSECARQLGKVPATILNRIKSKNPKFKEYYYK